MKKINRQCQQLLKDVKELIWLYLLVFILASLIVIPIHYDLTHPNITEKELFVKFFLCIPAAFTTARTIFYLIFKL